MIDRRAFVAGGLAVVATPVIPLALQAGKVYQIGVIVTAGAVNDLPGPSPRHQSVAALLRGLRDLGYVYAKDYVTTPRSTEGNIDRSSALAIELANLNVDVIVAAGPALPAIKQARIATPVVMSGAGDPIGAGFVASLSRPGGNFTGLSLQTLELSRKRLQLRQVS